MIQNYRHFAYETFRILETLRLWPGQFANWTFRLLVTSPIPLGQFAYWTVRLLDLLPTRQFTYNPWKFRLKAKITGMQSRTTHLLPCIRYSVIIWHCVLLLEWHNRLNKKVACAWLDLYQLAPVLAARFMQLQEHKMRRHHRRIYRTTQDQLNDLWDKYAVQTITSKFLCSCLHLMVQLLYKYAENWMWRFLTVYRRSTFLMNRLAQDEISVDVSVLKQAKWRLWTMVSTAVIFI